MSVSCNNPLWWNADGSVRDRCVLAPLHNESCKGPSRDGSPAHDPFEVDPADMIKEPPHYKSINAIRVDLDEKSYLSVPAGKLEALHVIEAFGLGWHAGNAVKYLLRAGRKGALLEDLRKAENLIGRLIAFMEQTK